MVPCGLVLPTVHMRKVIWGHTKLFCIVSSGQTDQVRCTQDSCPCFPLYHNIVLTCPPNCTAESSQLFMVKST